MSNHNQAAKNIETGSCTPGVQSGASTRAVHAGEARVKPNHALIDPIYQTSTYTFDNMADAIAYQERHLKGHVADRYEYGRYGNPTISVVETRLAQLENAEDATLTSSGMSAITSLMLHYLPVGSHVVLTDDSYRRSRQFAETWLKRYSVETTVIAPDDLDALEAAIRPETVLLFAEAPSNPYLKILDLAGFAAIGKRHGIITAVDSTFATPVNTRPLDYGVDLVVHSATKYLGGHNDLLAGFIAGREELITPLRDTIGLLGGCSDPNTAYLLLRGIKTLSLRVERHNRNGQAVAEFLAEHPKVEAVYYPGLPNHPGHALAEKQMVGFGGVVTAAIRGGLEETIRFMDGLRLIYISPSLGGTESLAMHPASEVYPDLTAEERAALGMKDNLVRLALGIEDAEDLIADLDQALGKI